MVTASLVRVILFYLIFIFTSGYTQTDVEKFLYKKRKKMVQPIEITLSEYAGPVPPPQVYEIDVHILLKNKKVILSYKEKAERKEGGWAKDIQESLILTENQVKDLAQALIDNDFLHWKDKRFTEQEHNALGLSFNYLNIHWGDKKIAFEYFLRDLENEQYVKQKRFIAFLKRLYNTVKDTNAK
ncbi:MAG: hypothetical protein NZ455_05510 [Bacteroidia bacterium]|nr:hypothetical protein [Bacteroidia bacterium]MDW8347953.1 hypothetical protein [Bacteroidia bacterium]